MTKGGTHIPLNVMLYGWKGKRCPTQVQGRTFQMKVTQLAAATLRFTGWKIKVYLNTELRLVINLTRLLCLHCNAIIMHWMWRETPHPVLAIKKSKISCVYWKSNPDSLVIQLYPNHYTELSWLSECISILIKFRSSYKEQAEVPILQAKHITN